MEWLFPLTKNMYNLTLIIFKTSILHFKFQAKMKYNKEMLQKKHIKKGLRPLIP